MIRSRRTRRTSNTAPRQSVVVPERLEPRQLFAAVFDSGGFESPRYTTGPIVVTGDDRFHLDPDGDGFACT